ncbi:MAG TPA: hypothetical protein VNO70_16505 [Blastocatellia bacterium]|nr:hypothetical protein [Blastocatellia bacterium]
MNHSSARIIENVAVTVVAAIAFIMALAGPISAQQTTNRPRPSARARAEEMRARQRDIHNREMVMRSLERAGKQPGKREQVHTLAEIKEDFERMQTVHLEMMRAAFSDKAPALDYKQISEATREIHKCANRMKDNLAVPDPEEKEKKEFAIADADQMKTSLLRLDDLIVSFTTNPHFHNPGVADAQSIVKAALDLNTIIELSGRIRREAERLNKASRKHQ